MFFLRLGLLFLSAHDIHRNVLVGNDLAAERLGDMAEADCRFIFQRIFPLQVSE